jgi:AP-4 complex subunit sigma-1
VIYRRYASLFFIVGTKPDVSAGDGAENTENELGMLEFIHNLVETMDKWAGSICEVRYVSKQDQDPPYRLLNVILAGPFLSQMSMPRPHHRFLTPFFILQLDIMYSLENVHFLLDEMVLNGYVVETAKLNVLRPIDLMERESQKAESMFR